MALTALATVGVAAAQPPFPKQGPTLGIVRPDTTLRVEDMVERIMAFDKNKDGKVTRDELPERMHGLIALGDTNKDGALDRDELKKLVATRMTSPPGFGGRSFGNVGSGTGGVQVAGAARVPGPGPGPRLDEFEGVVDDLKLTGPKKDHAMAAVKAHQENVRKLMDQAHFELMNKLKAILSEEELKDFQAALGRPRGGTSFILPRIPDDPRPVDVQRKNNPPGKEPDDLQR